MKLIHKFSEMQSLSDSLRKSGEKIGFVPTMGYFHEGHLSLMRASKTECDITIVSIFVNPTQFGPSEDYERYPRDIKRDKEMAEALGVDIIFYPSVQEMYPDGYCTYVHVEGLSNVLCGKSRPTHFRGVTTVVTKLFNIVKPHIAYFGQKDAQQAIIIKRLVKDLNFDIEIKVLPIIREQDGLAMSSRNTYLKKRERQAATILYKTLTEIKKIFMEGEINVKRLTNFGLNILETEPLIKVDYFEIVDAENLSPINTIKKPAIAAIAAFIGNVRLIDNILLSPTHTKPKGSIHYEQYK